MVALNRNSSVITEIGDVMTIDEAKRVKIGDMVEEKRRGIKYMVIKSIDCGKKIFFKCYDGGLRVCEYPHNEIRRI